MIIKNNLIKLSMLFLYVFFVATSLKAGATTKPNRTESIKSDNFNKILELIYNKNNKGSKLNESKEENKIKLLLKILDIKKEKKGHWFTESVLKGINTPFNHLKKAGETVVKKTTEYTVTLAIYGILSYSLWKILIQPYIYKDSALESVLNWIYKLRKNNNENPLKFKQSWWPFNSDSTTNNTDSSFDTNTTTDSSYFSNAEDFNTEEIGQPTLDECNWVTSLFGYRCNPNN